MVQAHCIQRHKDFNNNIKQYVLMDNQGVKKIIKAEELKEAIMQKQLLITNLTLTSDGRLVSKTSTDDVPEDVIYLTCIGSKDDGSRYTKFFKLKDLSGNIKTIEDRFVLFGMTEPETDRYVIDNVRIYMGRELRYTPNTKDEMLRNMRELVQLNERYHLIK